MDTRLQRASRLLNRATGGRDELFCARAARRGWWVVPVIDAIFWAIRREADHCRRCMED